MSNLSNMWLLKMFEFLTDECVSDHNERIRSIQIDKNFITQTFRMYNFIISWTVRNNFMWLLTGVLEFLPPLTQVHTSGHSVDFGLAVDIEKIRVVFVCRRTCPGAVWNLYMCDWVWPPVTYHFSNLGQSAVVIQRLNRPLHRLLVDAISSLAGKISRHFVVPSVDQTYTCHTVPWGKNTVKGKHKNDTLRQKAFTLPPCKETPFFLTFVCSCCYWNNQELSAFSFSKEHKQIS